MTPLAVPLRRAGYRTRFFGYAATVESMPRIVSRLVRRLNDVKPSVVIGHSLGGVLLRLALSECPHLKVEHFFMLGTPNQSPRAARYFWNWWPFRIFSGSCGRFLIAQSEFERLPKPIVPYTIFAGTSGMPKMIDPFRGEPNDRIVAVSETVIDAESPPVLVPAEHSLITYSRIVHSHIVEGLTRKS